MILARYLFVPGTTWMGVGGTSKRWECPRHWRTVQNHPCLGGINLRHWMRLFGACVCSHMCDCVHARAHWETICTPRKETMDSYRTLLKSWKAHGLSTLLTGLDIRANARTHIIKMFLLQSSKKLSDVDRWWCWLLNRGKGGPKLDFYKKNTAYLFPQ